MSPKRAGLGPVRRFSEIDSTNRYLADEARRGAAHGLVAVAGYETAGRGRLGRSWEAPPGANLLASVLLYPNEWPSDQPNDEPATAHACTIAVALAAADSCRELAGVDPGLKWPNDLVVDDLKLAGVLAEAVSGTPNGLAVVVGIGLNVGWPDPTSASGDSPQAATSLAVLSDIPVDLDVLLTSLLGNLDRRLSTLLDPTSRRSRHVARSEQTDEYRQRCVTLGRRVRVEEANGTFTGVGVDLTDEGHLIVETGGAGPTRRTVMAGDVVHLRHQDGPGT